MLPHRRDPSPRLRTFARGMRKAPTDAEQKLWFLLRDRKLAGFKFRRQYPAFGYLLDFYCASARLAVELDVGQHAEPPVREYDEKRTRTLEDHGIRILRFWDPDVLTSPDAVREAIYAALTGRKEEPSPPPSPLSTKERE